MKCAIESDLITKVEQFHGHVCPGLAIGIRAAEHCLDVIGHDGDEDIVAVCETDMCGVDAIQFLTGCTLGKGNLVKRDYGKLAFSFFRRHDGKAVRMLFRQSGFGPDRDRFIELQKLSAQGKISAEEKAEQNHLYYAVHDHIMNQDMDKIYRIGQPLESVPKRAAILQSIVCEKCGERVMESRIRMFGGQKLCIPCFAEVEQKI